MTSENKYYEMQEQKTTIKEIKEELLCLINEATGEPSAFAIQFLNKSKKTMEIMEYLKELNITFETEENEDEEIDIPHKYIKAFEKCIFVGLSSQHIQEEDLKTEHTTRTEEKRNARISQYLFDDIVEVNINFDYVVEEEGDNIHSQRTCWVKNHEVNTHDITITFIHGYSFKINNKELANEIIEKALY